jgi:nucleotide sugar dehydrogenase
MVAELAKLHENTFRAVNIALANELALMCDRLGVSSWEVIEAAASKPFAFMAHYPGPGLGGDCIPVVPHFLSWRLREYGYSTRLIDAAHEINCAHADPRGQQDRRRPEQPGQADPRQTPAAHGRRL